MNITTKAFVYSRAAHEAIGQKRKYTDEPYWKHPVRVAKILSRHCLNATSEMIAAAYLHDVVEDTLITSDEIYRMFGEAVGLLVYELTDQFDDPEIGNRAFRKSLEAVRLSLISAEAQSIKYADLIDNTKSIVKHDPDFAKVYLKEKRRALEAMEEGDEWLRERALSMC